MASILVVEDSPLIQEIISSVLQVNGHQVGVAGNASDSIKMLRSDSYDLIVMDLNMPGLRGESAIRVLRWNLQVDTPIIVLSGEITQDVLRSLRTLDISGFVTKSDDFEVKLLKEVRKALNAD